MKCKDIKEIIEKEFDFELKGGNRKSHLFDARMIYFFFCKKYALDCVSDETLAKSLGLKRLAVYHSLIRFHEVYDFDPYIKRMFKIIEPLVLEKLDDTLSFKDLDSYNVFDLKYENKRLKIKLRNTLQKLNRLKNAS